MTPKQQYYKNLADTMISHLEKRGFEASFVPDRQAALEAIMPYLTNGNTVSCVPSHLMKLVSIPL